MAKINNFSLCCLFLPRVYFYSTVKNEALRCALFTAGIGLFYVKTLAALHAVSSAGPLTSCVGQGALHSLEYTDQAYFTKEQPIKPLLLIR